MDDDDALTYKAGCHGEVENGVPVTESMLSKGAPQWQQAIVQKYGVGLKTWNATRDAWTAQRVTSPKPTVINPSPDFEATVTMWLSEGGVNNRRPKHDSIPLGFTVKCLQNLETWVPIGRLEPKK